jgi:hypothetical protein
MFRVSDAFQSGMSSVGIPPFDSGSSSISMRAGSNNPATNVAVHYNYRIMPCKLSSMSDYLDNNIVFQYSHDDSFDDKNQIANKFFSMYPKRPQSDLVESAKGGQQGEAIIALNLPFVNYMITKICVETASTSLNPNACNSPLLCRYLLPESSVFRNLIYPIGGMITPPETRALLYNNGGPDVRVLCIVGAVDVHNIWGSTFGTSENRFVRLRPGKIIGFVLRVVPVERNYDNACTITFGLDSRTTDEIVYDKDIVWKIEPYVFGNLEDTIRAEKEFTYRREFLVEDNTSVHIRGDDAPYNKKIETVVYKPYFWKIGCVSGPCTGGFGTGADIIQLKSDVAYDNAEIIRLPKLQVSLNYLGSMYIDV